ncbi:MAG: type II secretion system protein GspK [Gemmatimonadota bacterium]
MEDAGARLDVNRADEAELRGLLVALHVDAGLADRIAQAIADWRDLDDLHRPRGAERDWYERAGRPVLPRNGPVESVAELRHVKDVSEPIYRQVAPYLSVDGTGRVNLTAAPRPVLLALPGIGEEVAGLIERYRTEPRLLPPLTQLEPELSPWAWTRLAANLPQLLSRTTTETREVRIRSVGRVPGSPVRVFADALVVRSAGAAHLVRQTVTP